ncbi:MAG TPA: potassium/proton antiporter [Thermodesulfobacteriota bacterium]|nr:potassium/proton antiporter [Thermodesulfobacteriota bacterium]
MISIEILLLGSSILLLLSILASKASDKIGVPALLLFLLVGMLAGSEGPGGIEFDNPWLAQSLGVTALSFILFAGGLDTDWSSIRPVLWKGLSLSTLGVLITALLVGCFAAFVLDFSLLEGLLLGAIVSSTDAAAVFAVLRSRNVSLKEQLKRLLELESGSNDPMAVLLTIGLISLLINPTESVLDLVPMFIQQIALGALMGYAIGRGIILVVNYSRLQYEGLYPALTLALVLFTYGATASLGGNGFLAVYIAGLVAGNSNFIHKKSLIRFHDGLAWLMQITMFLSLGLLVFPSHLVPVIGVGMLLSLFLIFVARPASVFLTLLFAKINIREKTMISWVGLRGAVPIILATFPLVSGVSQAEMIFNLVFFIVLTSALIQGTSIPLIARLLKVDEPIPEKPKYPIEFEPAENIKAEMAELEIPDDSTAIGKQIVELGLPPNTLIMLINRKNEFIVPAGGTIIEPGDRMLLLADKNTLEQVSSILKSDKSKEVA